MGHDLGMVGSPGDTEANATSLWKNSSQSKPTAIVKCILIPARKVDGTGVGGGGRNEADGPGMRQVRGNRQVVPATEMEKGESGFGSE